LKNNDATTICMHQPWLHSILQASFFLVTRSRFETIVAGLIAPADRIQFNVSHHAKRQERRYIFTKKINTDYMKLKNLILFGLLFSIGLLNAQTDFRPGYIIKILVIL